MAFWKINPSNKSTLKKTTILHKKILLKNQDCLEVGKKKLVETSISVFLCFFVDSDASSTSQVLCNCWICFGSWLEQKQLSQTTQNG